MTRHAWTTTAQILAVAGWASTFVACAVFKPADPPDLAADLPVTFAGEVEGSARADRWWERFSDPVLNRLIEQVLEENPSVLEAWARLRQAQAEAVKAGAARWPTLDAVGSASVTERGEPPGNDNSGTPGSSDGTRAEAYALGLASTYELDLWGRVRSLDETARLAVEASEYDRQTAMLSLAAVTAETWFGWRAQQEQITLLEAQLEGNQTVLELIELRFSRSLATALDVFQQRQSVARVEAQLPLAHSRSAQLHNQLAVLLGRPPGSPLGLDEAPPGLPEAGRLPETGVPADLLMTRPDVRAGWMRVLSAGWGLSAARADRLPAIRLTARAEYANASFGDLFDNWLANLAGSLSAPLLDGGRRKAEVERARAALDERLASYRGIVLDAVREVEDALVRERYQVEHLASLDRQLEASNQTYQEAIERYRSGLSDYLPALSAITSSQALENSVVEQRLQYLIIRVALYRALGGGWMQDMEPPEDPQPRLAERSRTQ